MKKLKADAESRGFTYVDWNVCAEDSLGGHPSASTIYNNIIREVGDKNTCVVLMHDTNATKNTAAALPDVIRCSKTQATALTPWIIWKKRYNPPLCMPAVDKIRPEYEKNANFNAKSLKIRCENCKKAQDIVY